MLLMSISNDTNRHRNIPYYFLWVQKSLDCLLEMKAGRVNLGNEMHSDRENRGP